MTDRIAAAFSDSGWYKDRSPEEITALQLYKESLCVPEFSIFHEAVDKALDRSVQTFVFGFCPEKLQQEFESKVPNAEELIRQMRTLKAQFVAEQTTENRSAPLNPIEYLEKYDPFNPEAMDPYIPADGMSIRHTRMDIFKNSEWNGFMERNGHISKEFLLCDKYIRKHFIDNISLDEIEVSVTYCTYGNGSEARDATEEEMSLVCAGALSNEKEEPEIRYMIRREDVQLPSVSELTERGMSRFFTAAAELAESEGYYVQEINNVGELPVCLDGRWLCSVNEDGSGRFACGIKQGEELLARFKQLRKEIPEYLFPHDYSFAEGFQAEDLEMSM